MIIPQVKKKIHSELVSKKTSIAFEVTKKPRNNCFMRLSTQNLENKCEFGKTMAVRCEQEGEKADCFQIK